MNEFERFWTEYPRKVAKGAARKAFQRAIRLTDLQTMLTAIEQYKRHKPDYADFCHPATWLNGERWCDEWTDEKTIPMRETSHEEYREYLRSRGLNNIASTGPDHPAYGKPAVPVDWQPKIRLVK